jgi:hypothetical protein
MTDRRLRWLAVSGFAIFSAALALIWALQPDREAGPCALATGPAMLPEIRETSGLAVSRRDPAWLWTHNDSGNTPVLFAIGPTGAMLARVRVGARMRDWEDISAAPCSQGDCLYLADIGDNQQRRPRVQIYRMREPGRGDAETAAPEVFTATYADGPHNAEAMFVIGADLFIVTRDRTGGIYRATMSGSRDLTFRRIGQLDLAAVTDAETSRDGGTVVVRTSREAVFYKAGDLAAGRIVPTARIGLEGLQEPQGEGVALDGPMLYLSSEGRGWNRGGRIVSLRCTWPTAGD